MTGTAATKAVARFRALQSRAVGDGIMEPEQPYAYDVVFRRLRDEQ